MVKKQRDEVIAALLTRLYPLHKEKEVRNDKVAVLKAALRAEDEFQSAAHRTILEILTAKIQLRGKWFSYRSRGNLPGAHRFEATCGSI